MSYLVLARKWRPQRFEDIIGQQSIALTLANSIRLSRIGHAFLFSGPRGIGKTSTARILSKALNCENGPTPEPCNTCRFCTEVTAGNAIDVLEIDGASNRGIDEIRDLRENVKYSPAASRFKIIIIDEVHMLTREAFNALLKTLEEPPEHAKFILATTEAHKVPITIISRCQRFDFKRIDFKTMRDALGDICRKESVDIPPQTLDVLAKMADGGLRDGLSLLDQIISFSGQTVNHEEIMALLGRIDPAILTDVFQAVSHGDGATALTRFGDYIDSGGDETVFNRELMEYTRDIMAALLGSAPRTDIPESISGAFTFDQLERIFKVLLDLELSLRNTEHPRLLMDVALISMSRIQSLVPLEDLISRLDSVLADGTVPGPRKPRSRAPVRSPGKTTAPSTVVPPQSRSQRKPPAPVSTPPAGPSQVSGAVKAPGTAPTPGETILEQMISHLPEQNQSIGASLRFGTVVSQTDESLVIGFKPENGFLMERLNTREHITVLEDVLSGITGKTASIELVQGDKNTPPSLEETGEIKKKEEHERRMKMAMENPMVSRLVKDLNATIRDVRLKSSNDSGKSGGESA